MWVSPGIELFRLDSSHAPSTLGGPVRPSSRRLRIKPFGNRACLKPSCAFATLHLAGAGSPRGVAPADGKCLGDAEARLHLRRCCGARCGIRRQCASAADRAASGVASRSGDLRSHAGFSERGRCCGDRRASRPARVPNADLEVQHGVGCCAACGRRVACYPSVGARHYVLNRACDAA